MIGADITTNLQASHESHLRKNREGLCFSGMEPSPRAVDTYSPWQERPSREKKEMPRGKAGISGTSGRAFPNRSDGGFQGLLLKGNEDF